MSLSEKKIYNILVAEDDSDDRQMIKEAFEENEFISEMHFVDNGEDLIKFLHRSNEKNEISSNYDLILLDLNMPKLDGREALRKIKSDPVLKRIPIIVLTTSKVKDDILTTYNLGVNCYISKPSSYIELIEIVNTIIQFWFKTVKLPNNEN